MSESRTDLLRRQQLHDLRVSLGMTKLEASRLAGVSRREWHEAEAGRRVQPAETDERARMIAEMIDLFKEIDGG